MIEEYIDITPESEAYVVMRCCSDGFNEDKWPVKVFLELGDAQDFTQKCKSESEKLLFDGHKNHSLDPRWSSDWSYIDYRINIVPLEK